MDNEYIIFEADGLFGAKTKKGEVIIQPQYIEMYPFSCGLSMVRNVKYKYGYINHNNEQIIPFGKYIWCDNQFTSGYARAIKYNNNKKINQWGIIDTKDNIIIPFAYEKIWALKEDWLHKIKAYKDNVEIKIDLVLRNTKSAHLLDNLVYITTYSIDEFKILFNCSRISVRKDNNNKLYFTYGCNIGYAAVNAIPKTPVISIVINSAGRIFPLLHEKNDTGKTTFDNEQLLYKEPEKIKSQVISKKKTIETSSWDYETTNIYDYDPYGDKKAFYDGWNEEDVESGLADAYENDLSARDEW